MDLTERLLRHAPIHPLLVAFPGGTEIRLAVERELRERGWRCAASPAEANLVVVCGSGADGAEDSVQRVWRSVPVPRALVRPADAGGVAEALSRGAASVRDVACQRATGPEADGEPPVDMAGRGPDRDGLALDRLHVALGPVLPDWPAGLVVRARVQGDVLQHVLVATAGAPAAAGSFWTEPERRAAAGRPVAAGEVARRVLARRLDAAARLLAVAGWDRAAVSARWLRDDVLGGVPGEDLPARLERWSRRAAGSRLLRWSLRGLGVVHDGVPDELRGDAHDRLLRWLAGARQAGGYLDDEQCPVAGPEDTRAVLDVLPRLLTGCELAAARLVVASLDPDPDRLPSTAGAGARG